MKPLASLVVLLASFCLMQNACDAQSLGYAGDIVFRSDGPYIRVNQIASGSLAQRMGLRPGDYIVRINGYAPQNQQVIRRATLSQNGTVVLDVLRSNHYLKLRGILGRGSSDGTPTSKGRNPDLRGAITGDNYLETAEKLNRGANLAILRKLGIRVQTYTRNAITRLVIDGIDVTGLAYRHGLRRGDMILRANDLTLSSADDLSRAAMRINDKIILTVQTPGRSPRGVVITDKPRANNQPAPSIANRQPNSPQTPPPNQNRFAKPSIQTPQSGNTPKSRFARPSVK